MSLRRYRLKAKSFFTRGCRTCKAWHGANGYHITAIGINSFRNIWNDASTAKFIYKAPVIFVDTQIKPPIVNDSWLVNTGDIVNTSLKSEWGELTGIRYMRRKE